MSRRLAACPGSRSSSTASTSAKGRAGTTVGSGSPTSTSTRCRASATTATRRVELELDDSPSGLGWLPDGRLLVVAMESRRVLRVEPDGRGRRPTPTCRRSPPAAATTWSSPADGTAYVGNFGFDVSSANRCGRAALARVHVRRRRRRWRPTASSSRTARVITPDGRTLIVGETMARRSPRSRSPTTARCTTGGCGPSSAT